MYIGNPYTLVHFSFLINRSVIAYSQTLILVAKSDLLLKGLYQTREKSKAKQQKPKQTKACCKVLLWGHFAFITCKSSIFSSYWHFHSPGPTPSICPWKLLSRSHPVSSQRLGYCCASNSLCYIKLLLVCYPFIIIIIILIESPLKHSRVILTAEKSAWAWDGNAFV